MEKDTQRNLAEKGKILELGVVKQNINSYTYNKHDFYTSPDEVYSNTNNITINTERVNNIEHSLVYFSLDFLETVSRKEIGDEDNFTEDKNSKDDSVELCPGKENDGRCLVKKFVDNPSNYYLRRNTIMKLQKEQPEITAKALYNNYSVYRNITRAFLETFKKAILRTRKENVKPQTTHSNCNSIDQTPTIHEEGDESIVNRETLTKSRKILKNEYKKLKGKHSKINFEGGDDRCLARLTKDTLIRLTSPDPNTLINDNSNTLPPEKMEEFFKQNFFESSFRDKYELKLSEDFQINDYEVLNTLKSLKTRKAADIFSIRNEFLKSENYNMALALSVILTKRLKEFVDIDAEMKEIKLVAIPKGKDAFRPICINSCIKSIIDSITLYRLMNWAEEKKIITERQIGFMRNSNIYDHIIVIKELIKRSDNTAVVNFIDLEKAYNNIERKILYDKLKQYYNIPNDILTLITISVEGNYININGKKKIVEKGLPQGNKLSPLLFNLFINDIVIAMNRFRNNTFLFADDIALITYHEEMSSKGLQVLNEYCIANKIKINVNKSVTLNCRKEYEPVVLGDDALQDVESFKYLGIIINKKGIDSHANINECRKILFLKSYYLKNYLKKNNISNIGVIINLVKMFILSNVNFYWPLGLENKWSVSQLDVLIKKAFKITMNLPQRFPSSFIHAITNTEDFDTAIKRYSVNFAERVGGMEEEALIKNWMTTGLKICKSKKRLMENLEIGKDLVGKIYNYREHQVKWFGVTLYDKIPFETGWSVGIWRIIEEEREKISRMIDADGEEEQVVEVLNDEVVEDKEGKCL